MNERSYTDWYQMSDRVLSETIGNYVQHHRLKQNFSQAQVSNMANISRSTLSLLERGEKVNLSTLIQVLRVLNLLHVFDTFKINQEISPIAYLKLTSKQRKKASSSNQAKEEDLGW